MKSMSYPVYFMMTLLLFASCTASRVPFTQQIREQQQLTAEELKKIQFYTSNDLVLRRGENKDSKTTDNGELTVMKDGVVEEIIIKAGTPCVIRDVIDGNRLSVTFEEGATRYLVFASIKNRDGYYTLNAMEWNKDRGKINYGEQIYYSSPGSRDVFLTFRMKSLEQFKVDQKVVKGKKL